MKFKSGDILRDESHDKFLSYRLISLVDCGSGVMAWSMNTRNGREVEWSEDEILVSESILYKLYFSGIIKYYYEHEPVIHKFDDNLFTL